MFKQIFLLIIVIILGVLAFSMIPKQIAKPIGTFLIIVGIIAFVLAVFIFGFKEVPAKQWWE